MITGTQWFALILSLSAASLFVFLVRRAANKQIKDREARERAERK